MTIANIITTVRLILTFPFLVFLAMAFKADYYCQFLFSIKNTPYFGVGMSWQEFGVEDNMYLKPLLFLVFIVLALLDILDGYLARKRNEVSNYGKIMDPIADKIFICGTLIVLSLSCYIPLWFTVIVILRDLWITALRYFVNRKTGHVAAAQKVGKYKTVALTVMILCYIFPYTFIFGASSSTLSIAVFLFAPMFMFIVLLITFGFVLVSLYSYTKGYFELLKSAPKASFIGKK